MLKSIKMQVSRRRQYLNLSFSPFDILVNRVVSLTEWLSQSPRVYINPLVETLY